MNKRGRGKDDSVEELSFEDDRVPPRAGDPREPSDDAEISPRRASHAGMTSAEIEPNTTADPRVTSDDLSPETLFEDDAVDADKFRVADKDLRIVDADEIGGGSGLDEAELARATGRPD